MKEAFGWNGMICRYPNLERKHVPFAWEALKNEAAGGFLATLR